jgi:hypothetical protein
MALLILPILPVDARILVYSAYLMIHFIVLAALPYQLLISLIQEAASKTAQNIHINKAVIVCLA